MTSKGGQEGQVRALILEGLKLAEAGAVESALGVWERALDRSPSSAAARLLVYLAETHLDTVSSGLELSLPDFRSHLSEIGFDLEGRSTSGPAGVPGGPRLAKGEGARGARMPGTLLPDEVEYPPTDDIQAERDRIALSITASGGHLAVGGHPTAGSSREDSAPPMKRTVYGMPLRHSDSSGIGRRDEASGRPGEGSSSGHISGRGGPRYKAEPPPPATHRRRREGRSDPVQTPEGRPVAVDRGRPTGDRVSAEDVGRSDPWSDLSSELDDGPAEDWERPGSRGRKGGGRKSGRGGSPTRPRTAAPVWGEAEDSSADHFGTKRDRRRRPSKARPTDPLDDPFAILEEVVSRGASSPGSTRSRPSGVPDLFGEVEDRTPRPAPPSSRPFREPDRREEEVFGAAVRADTEPTFPERLLRDDEDFLPPPIEDAYGDEDFDLDSFLGEPSSSDLGAAPPSPDAASPRERGRVEDEQDVRTSQRLTRENLDSRPGTTGQRPGRSPASRTYDEPGTSQEGSGRIPTPRRLSQEELEESERLLEEFVTKNPDDIRARRLLEKARVQREKIYMARLGSVEATPRRVLRDDQLVWQNLDARRGFVLSRVDGHLTVQDIIDIVNMPRHETIRILADLVEEGILAIG